MTRQRHTSLSVFFALLSIVSLILVSVTTIAYADIPVGGGSWGSDFGGGWDSAGESGSADGGVGSGGDSGQGSGGGMSL